MLHVTSENVHKLLGYFTCLKEKNGFYDQHWLISERGRIPESLCYLNKDEEEVKLFLYTFLYSPSTIMNILCCFTNCT